MRHKRRTCGSALPCGRRLAFVENIPLAMLVGLDDAAKHSVPVEYQAAQDLLPLEGVFGLGFEVGPALDYSVAWLSTNANVRSVALNPALSILTTGILSGSTRVPLRAPSTVPRIPSTASLPRLPPPAACSPGIPLVETHFRLRLRAHSTCQRTRPPWSARRSPALCERRFPMSMRVDKRRSAKSRIC
jgi:hypothetical protein